jgi:putative DNA primase/helicase
VVAFDAGNLASVVEALQKRYPRIKIIICADDDAFSKCKECKEPVNVNKSADCPACKKPHGKKNTGVESASLAAMMYNCYWIKPEFNDPAAIFEHFCKNKGKLTDFNDLHLTDGLHTVRTLVDNAIDGFGLRGSLQHGAKSKQGGGDDDNTWIAPLTHPEELMERFYLVYGEGGVVFDSLEHVLLKLTDMRDACRYRDTHRQWQESMERKIVRMKQVGFDPAEKDPAIICNLWDKWPTTPQKGSCEKLLALLEHLCNGDRDLYEWIMKWLAYPIQHPGAKMKTALIVHGPGGTGKNLFFEVVKEIYGQYGKVIDQSTIEDKFTDWMSCVLFIIADEVVARSDLYHIKNKLKGLITGTWIRINTKNKIAYDEKNHANMLFLSNESMPAVLEESDRRYTVVWTPGKLDKQCYLDAVKERDNGGTAALHDCFLNYPLDGFNPDSEAYQNDHKEDLVELGKDNVLRFYDQWKDGELDDVTLQPALSTDIYELYRIWAGRQGVRPAPLHRVIDTLARRPGVIKRIERYMTGIKQKKQRFLLPPGVIELNPGQSRTAWLGECVEQFRESIERYKDNDYG